MHPPSLTYQVESLWYPGAPPLLDPETQVCRHNPQQTNDFTVTPPQSSRKCCECILERANDATSSVKIQRRTILRRSKPHPLGYNVMHEGIGKDQRGLTGLVTITGFIGLPPAFPFPWYSWTLLEQPPH